MMSLSITGIVSIVNGTIIISVVFNTICSGSSNCGRAGSSS